MELCFTASAEGVGEQEKTIKYRFFDAKELKQGVCRAEQAQATADDYATRVGLSNPTDRQSCCSSLMDAYKKRMSQGLLGFILFLLSFLYYLLI